MVAKTEFTLRDMQPGDSDQVAALMTEDESSMISTHFVLDSYTVLTQSDTLKTIAIVAEAPDATVAGLATATFGETQYEGQILPYASLDSWQVGINYRRQGLASRLVQATIERAEAEYGEDVVLRSGLAVNNDASRATASKWAREFFEPLEATILQTKQSAPRAMAGITLRPALPDDYAQIVERQNTYYADYNMYTPLSLSSLEQILTYSPGSSPIYHYWIAENKQGDILAGALLRQRGLLMVEKINGLPLPLRLLNMLARIVPSDNILRGISVATIWFDTNHLPASRYFVQALRWHARDLGSTLTFSYEPRNPVAELLRSRSPLQPRFKIAFAVRGPVLMSPERLIATSAAR